MFLNEIALGKEYTITRDDSSLTKPPSGYDSVVARGRVEPGTVTVPCLQISISNCYRSIERNQYGIRWEESGCPAGTTNQPVEIWWEQFLSDRILGLSGNSSSNAIHASFRVDILDNIARIT